MNGHFLHQFSSLENTTKCWICDSDYVENDVKIRYHGRITGKSRGSAHRDYNSKLKLNHKILVIFHNLKNHDSHLIMQELGKFYFKINIRQNGFEKYKTFSINHKLTFIGSIQFLSSLLDSLIKNLSKNYFKYLKLKMIFSI